MGFGDVGGNGSVKWSFVHHDRPKGDPKQLAWRHTGPPNADEVTVHNKKVEGLDPIPYAEIGQSHERPGYFKVTLRGVGTYYVQAVDRSAGQNAEVPMEIRIEW